LSGGCHPTELPTSRYEQPSNSAQMPAEVGPWVRSIRTFRVGMNDSAGHGVRPTGCGRKAYVRNERSW
jgi:hypothetical protein